MTGNGYWIVPLLIRVICDDTLIPCYSSVDGVQRHTDLIWDPCNIYGIYQDMEVPLRLFDPRLLLCTSVYLSVPPYTVICLHLYA